jgi:hypothetical protein
MFNTPRITAVACTVLFAFVLISMSAQTSLAASHHKRTHWNTYWSSARTQGDLTSFSSSSPRYPVGTNHHFR